MALVLWHLCYGTFNCAGQVCYLHVIFLGFCSSFDEFVEFGVVEFLLYVLLLLRCKSCWVLAGFLSSSCCMYFCCYDTSLAGFLFVSQAANASSKLVTCVSPWLPVIQTKRDTGSLPPEQALCFHEGYCKQTSSNDRLVGSILA